MKKLVSFLVILLADISALIASFYLAYYLRVEVIQKLFNIENPWFFPVEHFYDMVYLLMVFILIFAYEKLYTRRYDFFEEFVYIARGLFISIILIAVLVYLSRAYETFTRSIPLLMSIIAMGVVPLVRWLAKKLLMKMGFYTQLAAVIGLEKETGAIMPALKHLEARGYVIKKILEPNTLENERELLELRGIDKIQTLVIVSAGLDKKVLNALINRYENRVQEIKIVSDSTYLKTVGVEAEYVDELLLIRMANRLLSPVNGVLKRMFDLAIAIPALLLALPLFAVLALAIKLDSRGPIFFTQERFGRQGKKFKLCKFRSMFVDGDKKLGEFLNQHPELQEEWLLYKKLKSHDPRVTGVGKFLRRFSLDEAPQIFNILWGDMSIVGPRPYLPREKEEIEQSAALIFRVKSGLTGLWQIKGRNDLSFEARIKLDEFYVRNWSFMLDITIILKTFGAVLRGRGAY